MRHWVLICLLLIAARSQDDQPKTAKFGSLQFTLPAGWTQKNPQQALWESPKKDAQFLFRNPVPATGDPIENQIERFLKVDESKATILKATDVQPFHVPSGLKGVSTARVIRFAATPETPVYTLEGILLAGGKVHSFAYLCTNPETFKAAAAKELKELLESMREAEVLQPNLEHATAEPQVFGSLQFMPPAGWSQDARSKLWSPDEEGKDKPFFLWSGPLKATDEPLDKQFTGTMKSVDEKTKAKAIKSSEIKTLSLSSGLRAVSCCRELQLPNAASSVFTFEAGLIAGGGIHYLVWAASSEEKCRELISKEIRSLLDSIREKPKAETHKATDTGPKGCEFGSIQFLPPADWYADPKTMVWKESSGLNTLTWLGPAKDAGEGPDRHFQAFHRQADSDLKVVKSGKVQPLEIKSGLKVYALQRTIQYKACVFPDYTWEALFYAGGKVHYLRYESHDDRALGQDVKKYMLPLAQSVRECPQADGEARNLTPAALEGQTRAETRCCLTLILPKDWTEKPHDPERSYLPIFLSKRTLGEKDTVTYPIVTQVHVGTVLDQRGALRDWIEHVLVPETSDRDARLDFREVQEFSRWRLPDGAEAASMRIRDYWKKGCTAVLDGWLVQRNDCTLFMGCGEGLTSEYAALMKSSLQKAWNEYGALKRDMQAVALNVRFELPPVQSDRADFLMKKGLYYYKFESSSSFGTGYQSTTVSGDHHAKWTFHADRTCEIDRSDFVGMSGQGYNMGGTLDWTMTGFSNADDKVGRSRFEVRGAGPKDLWIIVRQSTGATTFHRMEPDAESTFGETKPKGLAIDGEIEGHYVVINDFSSWVPWK